MNPNACVGCGLITRIGNFLAQPVTSAASNTDWVLFVGAILIFAYLWSRVIHRIEQLL
jgi:hypothetical protein